MIRKEPGGYQAVYERNLYGFATKPGDHWVPVDAADKEKNVKKMEEICARTPTSIEEWALHGYPSYLMLNYNYFQSYEDRVCCARPFDLYHEAGYE